jgi:hypothetical protein
MKLSILSSIALLAFAASSQAASFIAAGIDRGLVQVNGTTAFNSGTIRFGTFNTVDFNTATQSQLEAAFIEVVSTTGPFTYGGQAGLFEFTGDENAPLSYTGGSTLYSGVTYDATTGIDLTNTTDIAGRAVYAWVMNAGTSGAATQQAIFSQSFWQDAQNFDPTTFFDSGSATLHIGSISSTTLPTTVAPAIQLAAVGVVPEPSRAVLAFAGVAGVMFRRRRK